MAYDKVVDSTKLDTDLKKIGNAIREKNGSSSLYTFPMGMVDAIKAISANGNNNNCEAYVLEIPNNKVNFKTTSGTLKAWGFANGPRSHYQQPSYGFLGNTYQRIQLGGQGSQQSLNLSVNAQGELLGLPQLQDGTLLITKGI